MEYQSESVLQRSAATFDSFAESASSSVEVVHGQYRVHVQPGLTVAEVRGMAARLNLPPEAQAVIDGELADEDTVLQPGAHLWFLREGGEKGRGWCAREE